MSLPEISDRPRLAVVRPDRVGDVIISSSCLAAIHQRWPGAELAWLVRPGMAPLFQNHPRIQKLILLPEVSEGSWWQRTGYLRRELQAFQPEAIVFLHPDSACQAAAWSVGIPRRLGYEKKWWNWTLTESLPYGKSEGSKHEAEYNFDLLQKWDVLCPPVLRGDIVLAEDHEKSLRQKLPWDPEKESFLVLNPSAFSPVARWPVEHFVALAKLLLRQEGLRLVVSGDREDDPSAVEICRGLKTYGDRVLNLAGKTSLGELACLLRQAGALVTRDTGPSHVAAAVGCPVTVIFGRTDPIYGPRRWKPLGERVEILEHRHRRSQGERRDDFWQRCFLSITPEQVLERLELVRISKK